MIVKAKPLKNLCEHQGRGLPDDYKYVSKLFIIYIMEMIFCVKIIECISISKFLDFRSDCWNDVDETEFACSEKKRILLKLKPPGLYARRKILHAVILPFSYILE